MQHMLVKQIFVINYHNRTGVSFLPLSRCSGPQHNHLRRSAFEICSGTIPQATDAGFV